jgi:hypothetical protein
MLGDGDELTEEIPLWWISNKPEFPDAGVQIRASDFSKRCWFLQLPEVGAVLKEARCLGLTLGETCT